MKYAKKYRRVIAHDYSIIRVSIIKFHHIYKTYIIPEKLRYSQSTFNDINNSINTINMINYSYMRKSSHHSQNCKYNIT